MATGGSGGFTASTQDDAKLHKLCREGKLKEVKAFLREMDKEEIYEKLMNRKGVFGYTPLHEAVAGGHHKLLDYLLSKSGDVNRQANSGYTPLHLAACSGHLECVRVLVNRDADISVADEYRKTAKETAELTSKEPIVRFLRTEEIIQEAKVDGDRLVDLLKPGSGPLEPDCLKRALMMAVKNDNASSAGKLVIRGAENIKECLEVSREMRKPNARAMLLLVKAAQSGDVVLTSKLIGQPLPGPKTGDYQDELFQDVQKAIVSGAVSMVVPIEIARRRGQDAVREMMLMKTDVNQEEGTVYWHGLRLLNLQVSWLRKITWATRLRLARNSLRQLPNEMGSYLKKVVKLDLQYNELSYIPPCVLELPSLHELNLSHNWLLELPDINEWSPGLKVLNLSHNQLSSMPTSVVASEIRVLDISSNHFRQVPLCICSFVTLLTLDLSDNPDILALPAELGRLRRLTKLNLNGLRDLSDPPRNIQKDCSDCIRYLHSKLRSSKGYYRMKLMLIGFANRGKTTLVARLHGKDCGDESTVGVDVSEWSYRSSLGKKLFNFSIWDFGGQEEYYATHQCFLSQRSLYLLLFNLKHGQKGVDELRQWLSNIALRAPRSRVIIVGTHLDEVDDEDRHSQVESVLQLAADLADSYSGKLEIMEVIPVGLKKRIENMGFLKDAIYSHAETYHINGQLVMGQMIPASYHALDKQLDTVQKEVRNGNREPIMHAEEFKTMVQQMDFVDLHDDDELRTATLFLSNVGSLLHYDDHSHNLHELYFIDPRWLCDMMAKVVTIEQRNPFVKRGILLSRDIPLLFRDKEFPCQYYEQYLTLLDRFEIALPLDNKRILIPSMLPDKRPDVIDEEETWQGEPFYYRYIIFDDNTPPGFWSRLLSRIMHSVPKVIFAFEKPTPQGLEESMTTHPDTTLRLKSNPELSEVSLSEATPLYKSMSSPASVASKASDSIITPSSPATPLSSGSFKDYHSITPYISSPLPERFGPQVEIASKLLPNYPSTLPFKGVSNTFDSKMVKLEYWRHGLLYADPDVLFRIEKLITSKQPMCRHNTDRDGVLIVTSPNNQGKKTMGQLVDLAVSLVEEWYPGLNNLDQRVPCYSCLKMGRQNPFEFKVEQCLSEIVDNRMNMECRYERHDPTKNHTVSLTDIVPDLLLQDIDPQFLLNAEELIYAEDDGSLLGRGGFGKVYRGRYNGKSVAIKKYLSRTKGAFSELRNEAKLLQKSHHPCLICLVGVLITPFMALVMEEAPMGSLERPLFKKTPIHRLTIYRIAAEIAAGLRFLHNNGIIFRDLKAANVLLWSLDYESLCHCKLTDFGIATHRLPAGAKGLTGTKGFIAPEVLYIGKKKQKQVYDHKVDIFSFGMFLYQIIARRHPYHDVNPQRIDTVVELGERPKLQDVSQAVNAYHYLTKLMKLCWKKNARKRPSTEEIIKKVCGASMQSVMSVNPIPSKFSLWSICAITPVDFTAAGAPRQSSELWVCCNGAGGSELSVFSTNTMVKTNQTIIKENQVHCMHLCGDHIWIGSRAGIEYGEIDIFNIVTGDLVHNIQMKDNSVSCITCSEVAVYLGTVEGYCFCFSRSIQHIQAKERPKSKYISEHPIDGILTTQQCVWISHTRYIYFLNPDNLGLEGSIHQRRKSSVGQLTLSMDANTVWSAQVGGVLLSAWDANRRIHKYDINVNEHLKGVNEIRSKEDVVITAMCPVLDTVWVGLSSGHITIFYKQDLIMWYHAYEEHIQFLVCVCCSGPCETEQCMVVSGAKNFRSPLPFNAGLEEHEKASEKGKPPIEKAGVLVVWEAYDAKTTHQIKLVEENAPDCFNDHHTVNRMIVQGDFKDGTRNMQKSMDSVVTPMDSQLDSIAVSCKLPSMNMEPYSLAYDTLRDNTIQFTQPTTQDKQAEASLQPSRPRPHVVMTTKEFFDIQLPGSDTTVRVSCPKPAMLKVLLSELQVNADIPQEHCQVEYRLSDSGERIKIRTQKQLENYLSLENTPQLFLTKPETS